MVKCKVSLLVFKWAKATNPAKSLHQRTHQPALVENNWRMEFWMNQRLFSGSTAAELKLELEELGFKNNLMEVENSGKDLGLERKEPFQGRSSFLEE